MNYINNGTSKTKNRDASIRWQGRMIEQFGSALNHILGLSIGALGFELSLMMNGEINFTPMQNWLASISTLLLAVSVVFALICTISRLRDFRITAEIARRRENDHQDPELDMLRSKARCMGSRTWGFFNLQILTFGIGVVLLVIVGAIHFSDMRLH